MIKENLTANQPWVYQQEHMTGETAELIAPYLEHRDFSAAKIGALLGPAGEVTTLFSSFNTLELRIE